MEVFGREEEEVGFVLGAAADERGSRGNGLPDLLGREGKLLLRPEGRHEPLAGDRVPCPLGDRRKKERQTERFVFQWLEKWLEDEGLRRMKTQQIQLMRVDSQ